MEQSLLGFAAAHPEWAPPADTSASLFLSQAIAAQGNVQSPPLGAAPISSSADLLAFTPANSTMHLAMRSQLYDNAYSKALQASTLRGGGKAQPGSAQVSGTRPSDSRANVAGTRSASRARGGSALQPLQAVDENPHSEAADHEESTRKNPRQQDDAGRKPSLNVPAALADEEDGMGPLSASLGVPSAEAGDTGLKGLLQHAYGTRW